MRIPACLLVLGVSAALAAPSYAQSLADVAKKREEQRNAGTPAPKVYTNDDLKGVPASAPPVSAPTTAADTPPDAAAGSSPLVEATKSADDKATAAAVPAGETKDRAYWSKRIASAREQLELNRVLLEAMQSRVNALTMDFVNRDDPGQRGKIANDRDRAMKELDRLKKSVATDEKSIPAIEEEARRAGVPPGWLR